MKSLLVIALLPLAANAQQLALVSVANGTETPVASGSAFAFGQVALGTTSTATFRVYNHGTSSVTVTSVAAQGAGFTSSASPSTPALIPPGTSLSNALLLVVSFTPTATLPCTVSCSASLTITSPAGGISAILIGTGVPPLSLTTGTGCSSSAPFNWGNLTVGASTPCVFTLQNFNSQAVTVTSMVVNGLGFSGPYGESAPFTLQPGQAVSFTVNFAPPAANAYTGSLLIGTQSFALIGTGSFPPLPTPSLQLSAASYTSGQQGVLTVTFPSPAPFAASGYVNLSFKPLTPAVADDLTIVFLAGSVRTLPFTVSAGATTALLGGLGSATFQTGTTEGTITFTLTSPQLSGSPPTTTIPIAGTAVIIDSTTASKERTGYLDITIMGADNTYSTGMISFAFFDTSGNAIGSAVSADFTSTFKTYFGTVKEGGSAFRALVSFPVTGSVASIGGVKVTLTNAAGVASTGSLTFQ